MVKTGLAGLPTEVTSTPILKKNVSVACVPAFFPVHELADCTDGVVPLAVPAFAMVGPWV